MLQGLSLTPLHFRLCVYLRRSAVTVQTMLHVIVIPKRLFTALYSQVQTNRLKSPHSRAQSVITGEVHHLWLALFCGSIAAGTKTFIYGFVYHKQTQGL